MRSLHALALRNLAARRLRTLGYVTLSEAKSLVPGRKGSLLTPNEILRRYAPQNDTWRRRNLRNLALSS
jgi:hypothetical protein